MTTNKTLEPNPNHPIIMELLKKFEADQSDKIVEDLVWLLFEINLLTSGFSLDEPTLFDSKIHSIIKLGHSIEEEEIEEMPPLVKE